ncbi:MAG: hypothetical protein QNJ47_03540 [Nostocaceae cyanobacterium]|nr:hypothetical protein [Nostocaceae cyanobacterium]
MSTHLRQFLHLLLILSIQKIFIQFLQSLIVCVCILVSSTETQAIAKNSWIKNIENDDLLQLELTPQATDSDLLKLDKLSKQKISPLEVDSFLIAAPENLNPGLKLPPPPEPKPKPKPKPKEPTESNKKLPPSLVLESLTPNFSFSEDKFGQSNLFIEETAVFRLPNGNKVKFKTGFNSFKQEEIDTINNIPLQFGWEGKIDKVNLAINGGVDIFNRLPIVPNFSFKAEYPIFANVNSDGKLKSLLVATGVVEHAPYKFNAETLDNQIKFWRIRPSVYWQIDPQTSFFSLGQFGFFNDGNQEFQSFSRLERKLGQFSVATNLFTWSFQQNLGEDSGYFSPPDFLVYNAEIAWQGNIFKFLKCRLSANFGKQRLRGTWDNANSYQALCTSQFSSNVELDLGYSFSNIRARDTRDSSYNNQSLTGQLRINF